MKSGFDLPYSDWLAKASTTYEQAQSRKGYVLALVVRVLENLAIYRKRTCQGISRHFVNIVCLFLFLRYILLFTEIG